MNQTMKLPKAIFMLPLLLLIALAVGSLLVLLFANYNIIMLV
jgi:hypothetical protein